MRILLPLLLASVAAGEDLALKSDNVALEKSASVAKGDYVVADADGNGVVRISANDVVLDFNGATLSSGAKNPDERDGTGIRVEKAKNVTIRNARIRGFRFGIAAKDCENLVLENCDVSESRAQHLHSRPDADKTGEDFLNLRDVAAWRGYGAGIWLEGCSGATVKGCTGRRAQNGILLVNSWKCRVIENDFSFNSGWGIGLHGSSDNAVAYNRADFCIRASWWPAWGSGADSAALVVVAGSDRNWIVANSLTHSGDGFFLTNRSDIGNCDDAPCNDNVVAYNDGSWTPANCFEATFSKRNVFVANKAESGGWGWWLGFSSDTLLFQNDIADIRASGVGIEHGSGNRIEQNRISWCAGSGVELWAIDDPANAARAAHPSKDCQVLANRIRGCSTAAVRVSMTEGVRLTHNVFTDNATAILCGKSVKDLGGPDNVFVASKTTEKNLAAAAKARFSLGKEVVADARAARTTDGVRFGGEAFEPHWAPGDFYEADLGAPAKFNLAVLHTRSIDPYQFLFDYEVVASKTGAFAGEETVLLHVQNRMNRRVQPLALPATEARFVRLVSKTTQDWVGICEFELYDAPDASPLRRGLGGVEAWFRAADDATGDADLHANRFDDALGRPIEKLVFPGKMTVKADARMPGPIKPPVEDAALTFEGGLKLLRAGQSATILKALAATSKSVGCRADAGLGLETPSKEFRMRRESDAPCGLDLMRADEWGPVEPK